MGERTLNGKQEGLLTCFYIEEDFNWWLSIELGSKQGFIEVLLSLLQGSEASGARNETFAECRYPHRAYQAREA